ncbi:MAG TPA: hypothetical protein VII06_34425 [Chloroflexota bacterium]
MRVLWLALPLLLFACDVRLPVAGGDAWLEELNEQAVAQFVIERADARLPQGRLYFRAGSIYSTEPVAGPGGQWVWEVRYPRVDAVRVPVPARDRLAGIDLGVDAAVRFEQRYCARADAPDGGLRCGAWQATACCNLLWQRSRGAWRASRP